MPQHVLDAVASAALRAYDREEEACGYLEGPAEDELMVDRAVELDNLANKYHAVDPEGHPRTGREYFKINSLAFERAVETGAARGRPIKVFFHSHLDCGAHFSDEDAASMTVGGAGAPVHELAYLVTSVERRKVTAHRLYVWREDQRAFREAPFEVVPSPPEPAR